MCNMAIEAGAKIGIIPADEATLDYVRPRAVRPFTPIVSDPAAAYARELSIDLAGIEPQVAMPHSPANVVRVREAAGTPLDQVFVGSCTNGRISDLREAAASCAGGRSTRTCG